MVYAEGACTPQPALLRCVHLGNEAAVCLQAHASMQEPGCRSPDTSPGWWTDQPSAGLLGRRARGSGPDAAKPICESGLGRWPDLTSAQVCTQTAEQGVLAPAAITVRGQPGAAWNALLLLPTLEGRALRG